MSVLVFEKLETLDPFILEWVLVFVSKIAIIQHTEAVLDDLGKKLKKTCSDCGNHLFWFAMRLHGLEYNQSQNVTKEERELMRGMRRNGESFRDIAYILERSVSTVHQNCQGVQVNKTGVYD